MEVHATVYGSSTKNIPSYVKNHGILSGRDLQFLLRETKVSLQSWKHAFEMRFPGLLPLALKMELKPFMLSFQHSNSGQTLSWPDVGEL